MTLGVQDSLKLLRSQGFAVVGQFLSVSDCDTLRSSLQRMIDQDLAEGLRDHRDSFMVHNPMFRDSNFYSLLKKSMMTEILGAILGESFILYAYTTSSLPPNGSNWARRIHVDCPRLVPSHPTNMNVFIPLNNMGRANGGIELLPGSQLQECQPTEICFDEGKVVLDLQAGELLVFNSRLWHSAGVNGSSSVRHAVTMNFCRSYMRQRFDFPRMTPDHHLSQLDETQLQLLGFNVRVPTSLDEYYLPESQRLYKPGQG